MDRATMKTPTIVAAAAIGMAMLAAFAVASGDGFAQTTGGPAELRVVSVDPDPGAGGACTGEGKMFAVTLEYYLPNTNIAGYTYVSAEMRFRSGSGRIDRPAVLGSRQKQTFHVGCCVGSGGCQSGPPSMTIELAGLPYGTQASTTIRFKR